MSSGNFADKRTAGGHIKQGLKAVKDTYKALYNRPGASGGAKTGATNLKAVATGKTPSGTTIPGAQRAKIAALGAASVTPIGPIAAFAKGVKQSIKEKKEDKRMAAKVERVKERLKADAAAPKPASAAKPAPKPAFVKAQKPTGPRSDTLPQIGLKLPPPPAAPGTPARPTTRIPAAATRANFAGAKLPKPPTPPKG